jgi:hypothetical protein
VRQLGSLIDPEPSRQADCAIPAAVESESRLGGTHAQEAHHLPDDDAHVAFVKTIDSLTTRLA